MARQFRPSTCLLLLALPLLASCQYESTAGVHDSRSRTQSPSPSRTQPPAATPRTLQGQAVSCSPSSKNAARPLPALLTGDIRTHDPVWGQPITSSPPATRTVLTTAP